MDNGKLREAILERSVFRIISYMKPETAQPCKTGSDAAVLELGKDKVTVISTNPVTYTFSGMEKLAIASAVNNVAVCGAKPEAVETCILLPERYKETALRNLIEKMHIMCKSLNIYICGGHTEVTPAVKSPVISVTAVGSANRSDLLSSDNVHPEMDIVVCGYAGTAGSTIIYDKMRDELRERFSDVFLSEIEKMEECYSIVNEAAVAVNSGAAAMHDAGRGGITKALLEFAQTADVGMDVDMNMIPIKQQTVELCEYFNINPYEMLSTGALIIASENGSRLVSELSHRGYTASVVGKTTDSNDRVFYRNGERAFIAPPRGDEIYKIFQKGNEK